MTTPVGPKRVEELRENYRRALRALALALVNEDAARRTHEVFSLLGGQEEREAQTYWRQACVGREEAQLHLVSVTADLVQALGDPAADGGGNG